MQRPRAGGPDLSSANQCRSEAYLLDFRPKLRGPRPVRPAASRSGSRRPRWGAGVPRASRARRTIRPAGSGARFDEATFTGDASFYRATFTRDAYFREATFTGDAWFDGATLTGEARFDGATFTGNARFAGVTFTRPPGSMGRVLAGPRSGRRGGGWKLPRRRRRIWWRTTGPRPGLRPVRESTLAIRSLWKKSCQHNEVSARGMEALRR
ncbi:hypothetical protein GT755_29545 [Herbidospora sp. NEAU-GS84]|uniref:Pentapeptide repeat-containing protein n=1 Tax=Herbidospora solisilvae TaxID=2696284 RepID=A0A7C9NAH6_9ACTN|nr:hypothetical protein [Herbidospora solisilvae]